MAKPKYTAGLHFIVTTPSRALEEHDRNAIRSHATKSQKADRQPVKLLSWISPGREIRSPEKTISDSARSKVSLSSSVTSIRRFGSDFSGLQLPPGVEPYMIQDLIKLIEFSSHVGYPYEICLEVPPVERGWYPYMMSDICCLHSMMFSLRAVVERTPHDHLSHLACFHYAQTLQLLQSRLYEFDQTSAISDATIMVVITLATISELMGDFNAVANHIKGLQKIVKLRGGVRALTSHHNMQVKVCKADLTYALLLGNRPLLPERVIIWDSFIADRGLFQCSHKPYDAKIRAFAETSLDTRLHNVLKDLHALSCISNAAYQTTRKISPDTYNEIMISILYRLINMSLHTDPLQEAIRTGLLALSSTIFLQRHFIKNDFEHLLSLFGNALKQMRESTHIDIPIPIVIWLAILPHVVGQKEASPASWQNSLLDDAILRSGTDTWLQVREILGSVVWIGFIHDRIGKQAYEAAMCRIQLAPR